VSFVDAKHLHSLIVCGAGYREIAPGIYAWPAHRPGSDWHKHGTFDVWRKVLAGEVIRRVIVRKQRWIAKDRSRTVHTRPPDDTGLYDALIVALELWCWLGAALGVHRYESPVLEGPSRRTVQRWLRRVLPRASAFENAVRRAVIERSEPRPMEALFPGGLSPPEALSRRRWKSPVLVRGLFRGLAMLFDGARKLDVPAAMLLAEARGRHDPQARSLV
jgi:hypothetical protein